jgi:hypothetical protein
MDYEQIKECLGPCGLCCETCFAHTEGDIRRYSLKLKEKLGNFDAYARRFETLLGNPVFKKYPDFKEVLDFLASENCRGCRNEQCRLFKDCGVRPCHQEKGVDFCHRCDEFPCNRTGFDERLQKIWVLINEKIKKDGLDSFCEEARNRPRYV